MSKRLWLYSEYIDEDEEIVRISDDYNFAMNIDENCIEITSSTQITLHLLTTTIDDELENANYHYMCGFGEYLGKKTKELFGEEKAKLFLFEMLKDKGTLIF